MPEEKTKLQARIDSGGPIVVAEVSPPASGDPGPLRRTAQYYAGKVHALGISDNRHVPSMSALAAASLVVSEGVEPILHVVTRDRNRIALISECLGAQALGIRNLLCTSGTHQGLGPQRAAKNVFDLDSIQLLQAYAGLGTSGSIVEEGTVDGIGPLCLGAVATPFADPIELQVMRLTKKVAAGAQLLITQPVFDLDRFGAWWEAVTRRGIHRQVAILAGVRLLGNAERARRYAETRPLPMVPHTVLERIALKTDANAQRAAGIKIAIETIERLSALDGLRGFEICGDGDDAAAVQVIEESGLGAD